MKTLLQVVLLFVFTTQVSAQTSVYTVSDGAGAGFVPQLIEVDENRVLLAGYSMFGWDSSWLKFAWLDNDMNVVNHKEYRMYLPLASALDVAKLSNGFIVGGNLYSSFNNAPFMFRLDTAGAALRQEYATVNPSYQEDFAQFITNANGSFTAYSATSNVAESSYRIDASVSDTLFHTKRIAYSNGSYFRTYKALDISGDGEHMLFGTMSDANNAFAKRVFIFKLDSTQIHWGKHYDFGLDADQAVFGAALLDNGNVAFVGNGYSTGSSFYDAFVAVMDTSGAIIWSKKLTIPSGGVYPNAILETTNNDLLVFGFTQDYKGLVVKLDASGNLIWKKVLTGTGGPTYITDAIRRSNGDVWAVAHVYFGSFIMMRLDEQGNSCALVNDSLIQFQDYMPTMENDTLTMTPLTLQFATATAILRDLSTTSSQLCLGNDIESFQESVDHLIAYPVPTHDVVHLQIASHQPVSFTISDVSGRVVFNGNFTGNYNLSMKDLSEGLYFLRYVVDSHQGVIKLLK